MNEIKFPITEGYSNEPKVIALGKFESIHKGHQSLLEAASKKAEELGHEFVVMLFDQRKDNNIYSMRERRFFINNFKPNYYMLFEPNSKNFSMSPEDFEKILKDINVKTIVVGSDYRYGKDRKGNVETLKESFDVIVLEKDEYSTTEVINSIKEQDFLRFKDLMGHYFFYDGVVVRGKGNGKKFNMPTANVEYPEHKVNAGEGIYFSYFLYDGQRLPSLTSISKNPTLNAEKVTYETFVYNFDKDIYGEEVYVELIEKYRDSIKFNSIEELIEKLAEDKVKGKEYFNI